MDYIVGSLMVRNHFVLQYHCFFALQPFRLSLPNSSIHNVLKKVTKTIQTPYPSFCSWYGLIWIHVDNCWYIYIIIYNIYICFWLFLTNAQQHTRWASHWAAPHSARLGLGPSELCRRSPRGRRSVGSVRSPGAALGALLHIFQLPIVVHTLWLFNLAIENGHL